MNGNQRLVETQLHDALHGVASATVPDSATPPGLPSFAPQHSRPRRVAAVVTVAAAVVALALSVVAVRSHNGDHAPVRVGHPSHVALSTPPDTPTSADRPVIGGFCDNFVPDGCAHPKLQPLWPYTSYTQALRYQSTAPKPSDRWRYSASAVGRRYLAALGYTGITIDGHDRPLAHRANTSYVYDMIDSAHRDVGELDMSPYGTGKGAPFEVVGYPRVVHSQRFFTLVSPRRTAKVHDTVSVRGRRAVPGAVVRIRTLSVTTVISTARVRADATGHWTATLKTAPDGVTTIAADSRGTAAQPRQLLILGFAHQ